MENETQESKKQETKSNENPNSTGETNAQSIELGTVNTGKARKRELGSSHFSTRPLIVRRVVGGEERARITTIKAEEGQASEGNVSNNQQAGNNPKEEKGESGT